MSKIEDDSEKWFREQLKRVTSVSASEEYDKGNRRFIGNGSIILFKYNPKTPIKTLKFFDANPLPIIIEVKGKYILGLNLHWVPSKFREVILKFVIKQNIQRIKSNKKFDLNFQLLREFLKRNGLYEVCIKKYIAGRVQGLQYIKYTDWKYIANLPLERFITRSDLSRSDVDALIYSHASKTRKAKNTRFGRRVK